MAIALHGIGMWSFNVITFGVDNTSSSHTDNRKNNFFVLSEGDTFSINWGFGAPEKKICVVCGEAKKIFCLSLHYSGDNSWLFVDGKKIFN